MVRDVYLWRQGFILFADYLHCFGVGFMLSFPSVLNTALLSPNASDIKATPDQASWIAASQGMAGVIGFIVMPAIMEVFGRKLVHFAINLCVATGFIIIFYATNVTQLVVARIIQGLSLGGVFITSVIIAEYCDPKRRGYFISIKKSAVAFGSLISHASIIICSWRYIALIGAMSNIISLILIIYWPESPAYLAMKCRYQECDNAHIWLKGNSVQSLKELEELISAQTEVQMKIQDGCVIKRIWKKITSKDFRKPFFITTIMTLAIESSGRYYNIAYIVQIMTDIVKDQSVAVYFSMATDTLTLIALWCSCFMITYFKRRTVLFTFGFGSVAVMFLISWIIFFKNNNYTGGSLTWLAPSLIFVNSFITNLGVLPICFTVSGEIFPLELRGIGTCVMGIVFTIVFSIELKFTPFMINKTGVDGTYAIYGVCLLISLIILNFVLNETKDKTLQEIEDEIKGIIRTKDPFLEMGDVKSEQVVNKK